MKSPTWDFFPRSVPSFWQGRQIKLHVGFCLLSLWQKMLLEKPHVGFLRVDRILYQS